MTPALDEPLAREALLYRRLSALGIVWRTYAHAPVFTVEEARALRGTVPGGHTKNLFLEDRKGALWLVVVREELRVALGPLAVQLGAARFSFASEALLIETLGVPAGSVTPFAVINDAERRVKVVLDAAMVALTPLNFHPLRNDRTTTIAADDLILFLRETGHDPIVAAIPERA